MDLIMKEEGHEKLSRFHWAFLIKVYPSDLSFSCTCKKVFLYKLFFLLFLKCLKLLKSTGLFIFPTVKIASSANNIPTWHLHVIILLTNAKMIVNYSSSAQQQQQSFLHVITYLDI